MEINHKDSNRQNNCINNLEVVTRSENSKHACEIRKNKTKIELEKSDEKQLIDKKYNAIMKKIANGNFPYKKQLQEHFPDVEFW